MPNEEEYKFHQKFHSNISEKSSTTMKSFVDSDQRILCEKLLKEINYARVNPASYCEKIRNFKDKIIKKKDKYYLSINANSCLLLNSGPAAFDQCIEFLSSMKESLCPLEMKEKLKITDFEFFSRMNSDNIITESTSIDFLGNAIEEKIEETKGTFEIRNFHYDKTVLSPEFSAISQIVDDTSSNLQRRQNIFDKEADSVGISCIRINSSPLFYCVYLVFGKEI